MLKDSEYRTYIYIEEVLGGLGWDTRNPARGGAVYTQHEFHRHDPLLTDALGRESPENIVLIPWDGGSRYWIIEAKRTHQERERALREAQAYADKVNIILPGAARFATGIAGTPDSTFYVTTTYWNGDEWQEVRINNYETTGFLSLDQCHHILDRNDRHVALFDDDPQRFLRKANAINKTLHANEIPVGERAGMMAALLLALAEDANLRIYQEPTRLMQEINGSIETLLRKHGKEDFASIIRLRLPATEKNHRKYRKAIIDTLQHLREMNIRSGINSGDDALGKFYETFLKYANGAKEMGIVLTPRHITRFAVEVVGVGPMDRVFDPACGTGGFLVSSMEHVRALASDDHYVGFRNDGLFGVEQRDDVYGLAMVNMIFRGDGKSRIYDGNCFDHSFWMRDGSVFYTLPRDRTPEGASKPFSRVLMNPPFKLSVNDETQFVDYGLEQMRPGGLLFAVLPAVAIGGKKYEGWRRETLKRHSVLACVSFDKDLFYPVAEQTYGLVLRAHEPHKSSNSVFMGMLLDDNHRARKSKQLSDYEARDNVERMTTELRRFLVGQPVEQSIPREQQVTTLNQDTNCSFFPEEYIPGGSTMRVNAVRRVIESEAAQRMVKLPTPPLLRVFETGVFDLHELIEKVEPAPIATAKRYPRGAIPVVSASAKNNGVAYWLDIPERLCYENRITISMLHNTKPCEAYWHPYRFSALKGKALVLRPIQALLDEPMAIYYLCEAITLCNAWRYSYARSVKFDELQVELPVCSKGRPDISLMGEIVRGQLR